MRFKITLQKEAKHSELVSCIGWVTPDEVYSAGDDHHVIKWNLFSDENKPVLKLMDDVFPTDMHWLPKIGGGSKKVTGSELFVVGTTDGKFMLISRNGRIEKTIEAHQGAVISTRWSYDGSALATAGEDGKVKIWSRTGMLRSTLSQNTSPIYSIAWAPDPDQVIYTNGKQLVIQSMQANTKPISWQAHDGIIMKVDWSPVNNMIISGAEDCKYKVWDSYGRLLYSSSSFDYPVMSLAWSPDGEVFAIGSFNTLRLCDRAGWSYALEKPNTGTIFNLAWSSDGTQVAGACGNGQVIFAHVIDRLIEWKNFEVTVTGRKSILVRDVSLDTTEKLEFRDRIIKVSIQFSHLVVATSSQCHVYITTNWNTPTIFDLKEGNVSLIIQADKLFLMVDSSNIYVYSYEGRLVCIPKLPGLRTDILNTQTISLSNDTLAVCSKSEDKVVHLFDAQTGKLLSDKPFTHKNEIMEVALDQFGTPAERRLVIIDRNRDLYITQVRIFGARKTFKLGTMIHSMAWNDETNMLAGLADGRFIVWYYPNAIFVDRDLVKFTIFEKDPQEFGKNLTIVAFSGKDVLMRRGEGALVSTWIRPYPSLLQQHVNGNRWDDAVRLCRFVKDQTLWACLAAMATYYKELLTAEVCYAAIDQADKVKFLQQIKEIPSKEARNAEMALLCGQHQDAEAILLQAGLVFRAIFLNIQLFNWNRALELSVKHKTHIDTVLAYRQRYLTNFEKKENNSRFLQYQKQVEIDWTKIESKIEMEYQQEREKAVRK